MPDARAVYQRITRVIRGMSFAAVLAAIAIASGATAVGCSNQGPTVNEYLEKSGMRGKEKIRIGVLVDAPLLGEVKQNRHGGFDAEFGRYIAQSLGFKTENDRDIEWVPVKIEDRERVLQQNMADIVLATYSITEERKKQIRFAGPYLITSQELLIDRSLEGKVRNLGDLAALAASGVRICVPGASTSEITMSGYKIPVVPDRSSQQCFEGMKTGEYQVFTTDELVLAGFNFTVGNQFLIVDIPTEFTERYGVGMSKDAEHLQALVEHALMKSFRQEGETPWKSAWNKSLASATWPSPNGRTQPTPEVSVVLRDVDDRNVRQGT